LPAKEKSLAAIKFARGILRAALNEDGYFSIRAFAGAVVLVLLPSFSGPMGFADGTARGWVSLQRTLQSVALLRVLDSIALDCGTPCV
jgi:hypothetical protein